MTDAKRSSADQSTVPRTADGYIRVSRVAGREGESFISPEAQRKQIKKWAAYHEVEILRWWEELDASGARRDRPMFQLALQRCETGETGGIVVARLDRFGRSAIDTLESIKRINEAGARFVSVEDNFDGGTPMGRLAIGIVSLIAELELERITESWSAAVHSAVERGVHISATPPAGYTREKSKGLVRLEPDATHIAEAFRMRALGGSWTQLADYLTEHGVRSSKGSPAWSVNGVHTLIKNRVYLGEARSGAAINPTAHEPLVTQAEFDAAQSTRTLLKPHDGSVASKALLGGLVRCAGCGYKLQIAGNKDRSGESFPTYYCKGRSARGKCSERATVRASYLDSFVEEQVLGTLGDEDGLLAQAVRASEAIEEAQRRLDNAEHELHLYLETSDLISEIGQAAFRKGVLAKQKSLDEARDAVAALRAQTVIGEELLTGDLLTAWPQLSLPEKRQLMHGLLEQVVLTRSDGRKPATHKPIDERTQIVLRGGQTLWPHP